MPGAFYVNQFANPANPAGARDDDRPGNLEAARRRCRCGRGRRRLRRHADRPRPLLREGLAEDRDGAGRSGRLGAGAARQDRRAWNEAGSWTVEGIGEDFVPPNCRPVAGQEGLLDLRQAEHAGGPRPAVARKASSPARPPARCLPRRCAIAASRTTPKRVVTFVCDSGNKYLSKVFNDFWLAEQGLVRARAAWRPARPRRPLAPRGRHACSSAPSDTPAHRLSAACARADVSQLPVIDDGKLVGIVDESDILDGRRRTV